MATLTIANRLWNEDLKWNSSTAVFSEAAVIENDNL